MLAAAALLAVAPQSFRAQDKSEPKVGLKPGEFLPGSFHPYNVTGTWADKQHCLVCEYGLDPVVLVFSRQVPEDGQPLTALLRQLDAAVAKHHANDRLSGFAVVLSDGNLDALKTRLRSLATAKDKELRNIVLAIDSPDRDSGLKTYPLDKDAEVTVLLYSRLKVVANYTFAKDKLTAEGVQTILKDVEGKLLKPAKKAF
jgi:hypothetical protein